LNTYPHATVQFQIRDIIHPYPVQVLSQLYQQKRLCGEVIAVTTDGQQRETFLVVRVPGVDEPVIVPTQKTSPLSPDSARYKENQFRDEKTSAEI
jgi:hypothetical protein